MPKLSAIAAGVVLGVAGFLLLHDLGTKPLELYDEGTYAQVVGESFARGDFLTFTWEGQRFFDKPPLYFWLAGIATALAGNEVLGIRLPAALFGWVAVAVVMWLTYALTQNRWSAVFAGLLLVATPPFIEGAREARLDLVLAAFLLLSSAAWVKRRYWLFGAAVGLAVLSKSVLAVFAVVFAATWLLAGREWGVLRERALWQGLGLGVLVALPWHLYQTAAHGLAFWQSYLGTHVFERFNRNLFGDPALQTDYTMHLFAFAPLITGLTLLSVVTLACIRRELPVGLARAALACGATVGCMLLLFYVAETRAFSYLLPVYPYAAALCAVAASACVLSFRHRTR